MEVKHLAGETDRTMRREKNQGRQPNVERILYIICISHSFFFNLLIIPIYIKSGLGSTSWVFFENLNNANEARGARGLELGSRWGESGVYERSSECECENRQTTEENGTKSNTIVNFNSFTRPMMIGGREGEEAFVVFRVDEQKCMRKKNQLTSN